MDKKPVCGEPSSKPTPEFLDEADRLLDDKQESAKQEPAKQESDKQESDKEEPENLGSQGEEKQDEGQTDKDQRSPTSETTHPENKGNWV